MVEAIREERFLILPHPVVGDYLALKGTQPERWLRGDAQARARRAQSAEADARRRAGSRRPIGAASTASGIPNASTSSPA